MAADDLPHIVQAHAPVVIGVFAGDKGLENLALALRRDARAVVLHLQHGPHALGADTKHHLRLLPPRLNGRLIPIAQQVAQILGVGFHCHLVGYDPYVSREKMATLDIEKADCLKEALRAGDLINISVPLNDSTRGMIGSAELGVCRPTAILVNTARGGIVDEVALYEALSRNELAAAASDVFAVEPPGVDMPLMSLPNFLPTPHIGANTEEALYRMGITVVEDLFAVLNGVSPRFPVP